MNLTKEALTERFDIPFNDDQVKAIQMAVAWYDGWINRRHRRQIFRLAGYAGTGKTTIAMVIAELCGVIDRAVFIAPTGKATSRLRQKGCPNTRTFHSFVYNVRGEDENGEPIFVAKGAIDDKPRLVVMDESSMVGEYDCDKLTGHGIPVLALYDGGQIEPVKARPFFTDANADVILEQIERNAGNIVRASMFVRQGKRLPPRVYDDVCVSDESVDAAIFKTFLGEDGVILCSYNNTRKHNNTRARRILGFGGRLPQVGEKLVCMANQHGYGIMNGEQGIVLRYEPIPDGSEDEDESPDMMLVVLKSLTDGVERYAKFNPTCFTSDNEDEVKDAMKTIGGFDFGYTLTVHKSQGSEWPRVLVIEEVLRGVSYSKLMYTAITRAIEYLHIQRFK